MPWSRAEAITEKSAAVPSVDGQNRPVMDT